MKKALMKIGNVLNKFNDGLELMSGIMAFIMMAGICFQVIMRYVFSNPIYGIDEGAVAIMIWICAMGWCTVYWKNGHAILEFIVKKFGKKVRYILFCVINVCVTGISVLFIPASLQLYELQRRIKPIGGLPFGKRFYYALPVIVMSVINLIYSIYKTVAFAVVKDESICMPDPREEGNAIE